MDIEVIYDARDVELDEDRPVSENERLAVIEAFSKVLQELKVLDLAVKKFEEDLYRSGFVPQKQAVELIDAAKHGFYQIMWTEKLKDVGLGDYYISNVCVGDPISLVTITRRERIPNEPHQ